MKPNNQYKNFFRGLKNVFLFDKKGNGQPLESPITDVLHTGIWDRFKNFLRDLRKGNQLRIALVCVGVFVSLGITAFPITNNNGTSNSSATIKNNWTSNSKLTASDLNNNFSSIIETLGNIPNWTKNGSDTYYTAGKVGIGTSTPGSSLDVSGTAQLRGSGSTTGLVVNNSGNVGIGTTNPSSDLQVSLNSTPTIRIGNYQGTPEYGTISYDRTGNTSLNFRNNFTGGAILLNANNGGNVGIGTTSPASKLDVNGDFNSSGDIRMKGTGVFSYIAPTGPFYIGGGVAGRVTICNGMSNSCDTGITVKDSGGINTVGIGTTSPSQTLTVNGNAGNTTGVWVNNSDQRLKKNIEPLTPFLDRLLSLRPVTFEWKYPKKLGPSDGKHIGFIAQEVEKVLPNWVDTDREGFKWLNMEGANAAFVKALQELVEKDRARDKRLSELEEENKQLRLSQAYAEENYKNVKRINENIVNRLNALKTKFAKMELLEANSYAKR